MRFSLCTTTPEVKENCIKNRELVSRQMTAAQIAEGQRLATAWKQKHAKR
jgi:hypothetical protein